MEATIVYLNNEHEKISARNYLSMSNKLSKKNIVVSVADLLFMSMSCGYKQVDTTKTQRKPSTHVRLKIEVK